MADQCNPSATCPVAHGGGSHGEDGTTHGWIMSIGISEVNRKAAGTSAHFSTRFLVRIDRSYILPLQRPNTRLVAVLPLWNALTCIADKRGKPCILLSMDSNQFNWMTSKDLIAASHQRGFEGLDATPMSEASDANLVSR